MMNKDILLIKANTLLPKETLKQSDLPSNIEDEVTEETYKELNIPELYKHILDPLPQEFKQIFSGAKESESGFAWVKKRGNSWRYDRQIKDQRQSITRPNIYELYCEVKKQGLIWGLRNLENAKITLKQCEIPENMVKASEFEEDYLFEHILDPIPQEYLKRFKKPNSSGIAWVKRISNETWWYNNPKDNVRIYESNVYNLYLEVKKRNLPWGVRDLKKAKKSLAQCEKPNIQPKIPIEKEIPDIVNSEVNCICFEENNNVKIIINGFIENDKFLNTLYKFKSYENNIKKIISNRHTHSTELFIELELEKNRLNTFKDRISMYGWKIIN